MRCQETQDDINTEHNMKSIGRAAMAQWTKRLTRNGQTRVRNWKGANILLLQLYCSGTYMLSQQNIGIKLNKISVIYFNIFNLTFECYLKVEPILFIRANFRNNLFLENAG